MQVECWSVILIVLAICVVYLKAHKNQYAFTVLPLCVLPLFHIMSLPLAQWIHPWCPLNYNEISARSMAQIKYQNRREYLDYYSEEMVRRLGHRISRMKAQFLVPVPVHPARKRQRGYNQAEELAVRLGKLTGIPVCTQALVRIKKTAPQKELTAGERLKNLEKAFAVRKEFLPPGTDGVILVDDIYTTGSTAEACSRVLKSAGVRRVYVLSVCIGGDR